MNILSKSLIAIVFLIGILGGCTQKLEVNKSLMKVKKADIQQTFTLTGKVAPRKRSIIQTQYNGYVSKMFVGIGDKVKRGDSLVTISTSLQAVDDAFPMKSPLSGVVVAINKQEGESVQTGSSSPEGIMQIDDVTEMRIDALAPEIDIQNVKIGQSVVIKINSINDKTYKGEVSEIFLAPKNSDDRYNEKIEFPVKIKIIDPDKLVKSGMSVLVDIVSAEKKDVLVLPHEYIKMRDGQYEVSLKNGSKKQIKLGIQNDSFVEVIGLNDGDEVERINLYE